MHAFKKPSIVQLGSHAIKFSEKNGDRISISILKLHVYLTYNYFLTCVNIICAILTHKCTHLYRESEYKFLINKIPTKLIVSPWCLHLDGRKSDSRQNITACDSILHGNFIDINNWPDFGIHRTM